MAKKTKTKTKTKKVTKKKKKKKVTKRAKSQPPVARAPVVRKCDYCGEKRPIVDGEDDDGQGGNDVDVFREICADCAPDVNARYACAALIFKAMEKSLRRRKKFDDFQVNHALQLAWKAFHADLDTKAMVSMARKLKVKHPWLKGKRAK